MLKIPKNHSMFAAISFVAKAVDTKRIETIRYLYADDKYVVGTDGHRLHYVPNKDLLAPGFYEVCKLTKKEVWLEVRENQGTYPKYESVIPAHTKYFTVEGTLENLWFGLAQQGIMVRVAHIRDIADSSIDMKVWFANSDKPIHIEIKDLGSCVLMYIVPPDIRVKSEKKEK